MACAVGTMHTCARPARADESRIACQTPHGSQAAGPRIRQRALDLLVVLAELRRHARERSLVTSIARRGDRGVEAELSQLRHVLLSLFAVRSTRSSADRTALGRATVVKNEGSVAAGHDRRGHDA